MPAQHAGMGTGRAEQPVAFRMAPWQAQGMRKAPKGGAERILT